MLRIVFLVFFCPYELVADEAHYWEWSRRPSLSYHTKGPGVAWTIGASTAIFGHHEWSVRLPTAIAGFVSTLAIAGLAFNASGGRKRVAVAAAILFNLAPGYQATNILMTIDGPYVACWILAAWAGWCLVKAWQQGESNTAIAAGLGLAMGVGFLFKYTILLLLVGQAVAFFLVIRRSGIGGRAVRDLLVAFIVFVVTISPVLIWNHQQGWPTVSHLIGHLGMGGGDIPDEKVKPWQFNPMWPVEFIGSQLGIANPAMLALIAMTLLRFKKHRARQTAANRAHAYMTVCGLPVVLFYVLISFVTDAEGNWPLAGYSTLLVSVAMVISGQLRRYRAMVRKWSGMSDPKPKMGFMRAKPETAYQVAWHWALGIGVGTGIGMMVLPAAAHLPVVGPLVPTYRFTGAAERAMRVDAVRKELTEQWGEQPLIMADKYQKASLLAFYLPDHPRISSVASYFGDRVSPYDYFEDVDPRSPERIGHGYILVGGSPGKWQSRFLMDDPKVGDEELRVFYTSRYRGLREQPKQESSDDSTP